MRRSISILLVLALVLSFIPVLSTPVRAVTQNQQNIVDRADYMYNLTWVAQETINGWRDQYTFYEGNTYRVPYGQPVYSGAYIGYGVSVEDFLAAAAESGSVFYTKQSEYAGKTSTYYATDCSAFVSWCWGISRNTTYSIPSLSTNLGMATESNIRTYLQLGDALNSSSAGHVVLVTDLTYDESGTLIQIEITEQTPPQLKRSYYTPTELAAKYASQYSICRYEGAVPEAPDSGYLTDCDAYAAHCKVEIMADTAIMTLPCGTMTDGESTQLGTALAEECYTATKLYQNTVGELWYGVTTADGEEGYILAGDTAYTEQVTDDIAISGVSLPNAHVAGKSFYVQGVITSALNDLSAVAVYIYKGFGRDGERITGCSDSVSDNYYSLKYSTIDDNTVFGKVAVGENTYVISADYVNHYVKNGVILQNTGTVYLVEEYFVTVSSSVSQSTCAHSYSDTTTVAATCTSAGAVVHACAVCGYVYEEELPVLGHSYNAVVTAPTCVAAGYTTHTCGTCGDTYTDSETAATGVHTYVEGTCTGCGAVEVVPSVKMSSVSLALKDEVKFTGYFTIENIDASTATMGLMTFENAPTDVSITTADHVIPGATYQSSKDRYIGYSQGIPAKEMGDLFYICAYVQLEDGTYVYSDVVEYSVEKYAYAMLDYTNDADLQKLLIAMLNYGAEAQLYFGYNTDDLVNADLTDEQKNSLNSYSSDLMDAIVTADSSKTGNFVYTEAAFSTKTVNVTAGGALALNCRFNPAYTMDGDMTMYYWDAATYNSVDELTVENATGSATMTVVNGAYQASVTGIAAKDIDKTIYAVGVYESDGVTYTTGVISYNLNTYFDILPQVRPACQGVCEAAVVYCDYAKLYFLGE